MIELRWIEKEERPVLQYRQKPDSYIYPSEWPRDIAYEAPWSDWQDVPRGKPFISYEPSGQIAFDLDRLSDLALEHLSDEAAKEIERRKNDQQHSYRGIK